MKNNESDSSPQLDGRLTLEDFSGDYEMWNRYNCDQSYGRAVDVMDQMSALPSYDIDLIKTND